LASVGGLGASYDVALSKAWTLAPFARLDLAGVSNAGFTEAGSTDFNLRVDGETHGTVSGEAGLQLSGQATLRSGLTIRPLLSVSAEGLGDPNWSPTAQFVEGPVAEGFRSLTSLPAALGKVSAAIQLSKGPNWSLQLQYGAQAGGGYLAQSGGGAFIARF
jgi:outer membrane autotransporter protein